MQTKVFLAARNSYNLYLYILLLADGISKYNSVTFYDECSNVKRLERCIINLNIYPPAYMVNIPPNECWKIDPQKPCANKYLKEVQR